MRSSGDRRAGRDEESLLGTGACHRSHVAFTSPQRAVTRSHAGTVIRKIPSFWTSSRDFLIGILMALVSMSFLACLDVTGVIRIHSLDTLRLYAVDPHSSENSEEMIGLKFIPMAEYKKIRKETTRWTHLLDSKRTLLEAKSKEAVNNRAFIEALQKELEELKQKLELEKWCGTCSYTTRGGNNQGCNERLNSIMNIRQIEMIRNDPECDSNPKCFARIDFTTKNYGKDEFGVKLEIMRKEPQCKTSDV